MVSVVLTVMPGSPRSPRSPLSPLSPWSPLSPLGPKVGVGVRVSAHLLARRLMCSDMAPVINMLLTELR